MQRYPFEDIDTSEYIETVSQPPPKNRHWLRLTAGAGATALAAAVYMLPHDIRPSPPTVQTTQVVPEAPLARKDCELTEPKTLLDMTGYVLRSCINFSRGHTDRFEPYSGYSDTVVGAGHRPEKCAYLDNALQETQDADGATCGGSTTLSGLYGLWEVRMRALSTADTQGSAPHPVLILWPDSDRWQEGEIDFFETDIGDQAEGYVHCVGHPQDNCYTAPPSAVDYSQYHTYSLEWRPDRITAYVDGQSWWSTDNTAAIPQTPMHLTMQLDNLSGKTPVASGRMDIEWVRMFSEE